MLAFSAVVLFAQQGSNTFRQIFFGKNVTFRKVFGPLHDKNNKAFNKKYIMPTVQNIAPLLSSPPIPKNE